MCHLNVVFKNCGDDMPGFPVFLQSVTARSYATNSDGDGVYFDGCGGVRFASCNKLDYLSLPNRLFSESSAIVTHQRLISSGMPEDLHPFVSDDFILIHNGVIPSFTYGVHSDTYNIFKRLCDDFKLAMQSGTIQVNRRKWLISWIADVFKSCGGSWSILVGDRVSRSWFYFRNTLPINAYRSKRAGVLYMTTSERNDVFLPLLDNNKWHKYYLMPYVIYRVDYTGFRRVYNIDTPIEVTSKVRDYESSSRYDTVWLGDFQQLRHDNMHIPDRATRYSVSKHAWHNNTFCSLCGGRTVVHLGRVLCTECDRDNTEDYTTNKSDKEYNTTLIKQSAGD